MSRPKQFDDEQLLDALRATYLELGPGASTQELAHAAGVSEGTLFKRFGTKRKIFMAAMRLPLLEDRAWYIGMLDRVGEGSFEEHLRELALELQAFADQVIPLMQMISANGKLAQNDVACLMRESDAEDAPPFVLLARFATLFEREMALGRIRRTDPRALASLFVGALFHDFHLRMHFPTRAHEGARELALRVARCIAELTALPAGLGGSDATDPRAASPAAEPTSATPPRDPRARQSTPSVDSKVTKSPTARRMTR